MALRWPRGVLGVRTGRRRRANMPGRLLLVKTRRWGVLRGVRRLREPLLLRWWLWVWWWRAVAIAVRRLLLLLLLLISLLLTTTMVVRRGVVEERGDVHGGGEEKWATTAKFKSTRR